MKKLFLIALLLVVNFFIVASAHYDSGAIVALVSARQAHQENPTQETAQRLKEAKHRTAIESLYAWGFFLVVLAAGNVIVIWGVRRVHAMLKSRQQ